MNVLGQTLSELRRVIPDKYQVLYVIYLEQGVKEPGETLKLLPDWLEEKENKKGEQSMATGIYKRGEVWWIRYTGIDGKQKRERSGNKFQDASLLLAQRKNAIGQVPGIQSIPNHLFPELTEKYINWIAGRQASAKVKGYIIGQLKRIFGNLPLKGFNTEIVEQQQTDLINKKYKASSNNKVLNVLKVMFTKAVEWEMVEEAVLKRIRKVKPYEG